MGNCTSTSDAERNFAEAQNRRASPYNQPGYNASPAPPGQPPRGAGLAPPGSAHYGYSQAPGDQQHAYREADFGSTPWNLPPAYNTASQMPYGQPAASSNQDGIHGSGNIARKAGELLIISYDLGTTASGCAYMFRDTNGQIDFGPEVVDQWPGQTATSLGKTPSVLFYDSFGRCLPEWGAECFGAQWSGAKLTSLGIHKTEWYKLHIDPTGVPEEHFAGSSHQLPHGVTAWQVYADYLQRLHTAAISRFETRRGADLFRRLSASDRVQYILTIPAAWQKPSIVGELRKCAMKAGLIRNVESLALDFCSEPEASALECFNAAPQVRLGPGDRFSVVDAGGGTVDFTTYEVLTISPSFTMKEVDVGSVRCLYRGGTFVDKSFSDFLHAKLSKEYPYVYHENHRSRGMKEFTTSIKLQFSNSDRRSIFLQLSDGNEFDQGCIELQWQEVEECFKPHVDRILEVAKVQVNSGGKQSKVVFCSGGFGSNDYLRQRLEAELPGVQILQPGDKSAGSKAVSLGATRYGMFRSVQSRTSPAWYGVKAFRTFTPAERDVRGALRHLALHKTGKQILEDIFSVVLSLGDSVQDDEWRSSKFNIELSDDMENGRKGKLLIYECHQPLKPEFIDEPGIQFLCRVDVYVPPQSQGRLVVSTSGSRYHSYEITVLLSLGRADLRSRVLIDGVEAGGATVTWQE